MTRRIRIEPNAEAELQAAAEWEPRAGLGEALLDAASAVYRQLASGNRGVPVPHSRTGARRLPMKRFPFWVVFIKKDKDVLVIAYAHQKRRPGYWLERLSNS